MSDKTAQLTAASNKIWTRDFLFICFANFFIFLGYQMTLPTIPLFVEYLGGNDQLIGIVVGIFTFSALFIRPWAGHALETKGRRFIYLFGLAVFVISVGSFTIVTSLFFLILMRIVQGIGWGLSTTAGGTIVTDLIPKKRRGEGMGYFGLSGNIAMAFGPAFGLVLITIANFHILFFICAFFGAAALLFSSFIRYKPVESITVQMPRTKWDFYEKSAFKPAILFFFITLTYGGIASFLPLYAIEAGVKGIEWYFFYFAISVMISRTFGGRLYDRRGIRVIFIPGAISMILGMLLLTLLVHEWMLISAALFYGLGFGMVHPALHTWAMNRAPSERKGMANATFYSFIDLGIGLGAMLFGFIPNFFGYSGIYATAVLFIIISIILYICFMKKEFGT